jgi:hypothetical protein
VALLGPCSLPAIVALITVRGPLTLAAQHAQSGVAAGRAGDIEGATASFAKAEALFATSESTMSGPLRSLGLAVPALSSNLRAARTLAAAGRQLSDAGVDIARTANPDALTVTDGRVDVAALAQLTQDLTRAQAVLDSTNAAVDGVRYPYLLPQVRHAVDRLGAELERADHDATAAHDAATVAPFLLGVDGPKRYFLAVQNNAEARATGGFIGNFGEVVADGGKLQVERFGRIGELNPAATAPDRTLDADADFQARYGRFQIGRTWQNVNVSPDLPTVAKVVSQLYPQSGGRAIDGVIAIDPVGLAALLELTGPVQVAPWPEPISATNVVQVTLEGAYERFPVQEQRVAFLGDVSDTVVRAVTTGSLGGPAQIVRTLSPAVRDGHLRMAVLVAKRVKTLQRLGIAGAIPRARSDSLLLTTQNAAGNKLDVYLRRKVDYDVTLSPTASGKLSATGRATVTLDNDLPDRTLPAAVVGPYDTRFAAGENRSFVSLYSPLSFQGASLEGAKLSLESGRELGRNVYSGFVSIPGNERRTLQVDLAGTLPNDDGWYRLDLVPQPAVLADQIHVRVGVPVGWKVTATTDGADVAADGRSATFDFEATAPTQVAVRLGREREHRLLPRLLWPTPR